MEESLQIFIGEHRVGNLIALIQYESLLRICKQNNGKLEELSMKS